MGIMRNLGKCIFDQGGEISISDKEVQRNRPNFRGKYLQKS